MVDNYFLLHIGYTALLHSQLRDNRNVQHRMVLHVNMMLSVVCCNGRILTTSCIQVLPPQLFTPPSPQSTQSPGNRELRETGMLLYLAWPGLRGPANCPACPHILLCGHSGTHTRTQPLLRQRLDVAAPVIHHSSPQS